MTAPGQPVTTHEHTWDEHQEWERDWWGDCTNTYAEETKQRVYAEHMGLVTEVGRGQYPVFNIEGRSVLDIGGGPVSLLLKCYNRGPRCWVADPCRYPKWVRERYDIAGIAYVEAAGEDVHNVLTGGYDEVWIYNVLQHTQDPELIIANAWKMAPVIRMFEWIDIPPTMGHPHELKKVLLDYWLHGDGGTEQMDGSKGDGCDGNAYFGRFERP